MVSKYQAFWNRELNEMISGHGNDPNYFWKIIHLMTLRYTNGEFKVRGKSFYEIAPPFFEKFKTDMEEKHKVWLEGKLK